MLTMNEILEQEKKAVLRKFDKSDAWTLGNIIRDLAGENREKIIISIKLYNQELFLFVGDDTVKDNEFWAYRKRNVVDRHGHSSYFVSQEYEGDEAEYYRHNAVNPSDFAIHGGGFPIQVENVGQVGNVVVSGLVSEEDHLLCYNGIITLLSQQ